MFTMPQLSNIEPRGTISTFTVNGTTQFGWSVTKGRASMSTNGSFCAAMDSIYTTGDIRIFQRDAQNFSYHSNINTTIPSSGDIQFKLNSDGTKITVLINGGGATNLYLYTRSGTTWSLAYTAAAWPTSLVNGMQLSASDDFTKIVVSDGSATSNRGRVTTFDSTLTQLDTFVIEDTTAGDNKYHGTGMDISGDGTLLVTTGSGNYTASKNSELRAFSWSGTAWTPVGTYTLITAASMSTAFQSQKPVKISYSGGVSTCKIAVSAWDVMNSTESFVRVLTRSSSSALSSVAVVTPPVSSVRFGFDVAVTADGLAAYVSDNKKTHADSTGSVYKWDYTTLTEYHLPTGTSSPTDLGSALAVDGDGTILVALGSYLRTTQFAMSL